MRRAAARDALAVLPVAVPAGHAIDVRPPVIWPLKQGRSAKAMAR